MGSLRHLWSAVGQALVLSGFQMALAKTTELPHRASNPLPDHSNSWGRVLIEAGSAQGLYLDWSILAFTTLYWPKHVKRPIHIYEVGEFAPAFDRRSHKITLQKIQTQCKTPGQQTNLLKSPNINYQNMNNAFPIRG